MTVDAWSEVVPLIQTQSHAREPQTEAALEAAEAAKRRTSCRSSQCERRTFQSESLARSASLRRKKHQCPSPTQLRFPIR
jgi:hypothetical protein